MKRIYEIDTWRGRDDLNRAAIKAAKAYSGKKFTVSVGEWGVTTYLVFADSKEEAAAMINSDGKPTKVRDVTNCKKYN